MSGKSNGIWGDEIEAGSSRALAVGISSKKCIINIKWALHRVELWVKVEKDIGLEKDPGGADCGKRQGDRAGIKKMI